MHQLKRTTIVILSVVAWLPPIQPLRRWRGTTLQELASAAGIDPAHLDVIERGSHFAAPHLQELEAFAHVLGVTVDEVR